MNDSGTSGQIVKREKPLRAYAVKVDGYSTVQFEARSAAKARAMAYRAFCDAGGRWSFHNFLIMSRVWLVGDWEPARDDYPDTFPERRQRCTL